MLNQPMPCKAIYSQQSCSNKPLILRWVALKCSNLNSCSKIITWSSLGSFIGIDIDSQPSQTTQPVNAMCQLGHGLALCKGGLKHEYLLKNYHMEHS